MKWEWDSTQFTVIKYRDTNSYILKNTETIFELLDD